MITVKDKLNRTSVLIKRSNDVEVEYVTTDRLETDVVALNDQITSLDRALDNVTTKDDFNTSIDYLNNDIDFILHKVEKLEDEAIEGQKTAYNKGYREGTEKGYANGYTEGNEQGYNTGLNVGIQQGYDNGYNKGTEDGYTNGVSDQKAKLQPITIKRNGNYVNENGYNEVIVDVPTNDDGDYDTGYSEGYSTGYGKGTADGITVQKAKLTNITITKNGTYVREDGYNDILVEVPISEDGSYDEGYEAGLTAGDTQGYLRGMTEQKAKLRPITIIKNGTYSNDNGYNNIVVDVPTENDGDYDIGYSEGYNEGYTKGNNDGYTKGSNDGYDNGYDKGAEDGYTNGYNKGNEQGYTSGIADQKAKLTNITITKNGTYETEDGYSSVIVNVPNNGGGGDGTSFDYSVIGYSAEIANAINTKQNEDIAYSQALYNKWDPNSKYPNNFFDGDDRLVYAPLVDTSNLVEMYNMFDNCISLRIVPNLNTNNVNSMFNMFGGCKNLETVFITNYSTVTSMDNMFEECTSFKEFDNITTTNVEDMGRMFYGCETLEKVRLDATSCVSMEFMFYNCKKLKEIELINTGKCNNMEYCFRGCRNLTSIPPINTYRVVSLNGAFSDCTKLKSVPKINCANLGVISDIFFNSNEVTELGGFENLRINWNDSYGLANCPKLTYQSVMNVINNLYDFRANGDTTTKTLKLHSNSLAMLSNDDIAIATTKGWILTK